MSRSAHARKPRAESRVRELAAENTRLVTELAFARTDAQGCRDAGKTLLAENTRLLTAWQRSVEPAIQRTIGIVERIAAEHGDVLLLSAEDEDVAALEDAPRWLREALTDFAAASDNATNRGAP